MSSFSPVTSNTWQQHGGFYRPVGDLTTPWVASPISHPPALLQTPALAESQRHEEAAAQVPMSPKPRRVPRLWRLLRKWFRVGKQANHTRPIPVIESSPPPVDLSEWKAWGYYASPTVNGVEVRNYPPAAGPRIHADPERIFSSLRDPDGTQHPERWIPGLEHPSLPPRPRRWVEPNADEALPFPKECQLNPFLKHPPYGPAPLRWDIGKDPMTAVMYGDTPSTIPLSRADQAQPATWPFLTYMYVNAVADDAAPRFPWPCMVRNPKGITCGDVFATLYKNFEQHIHQDEHKEWGDARKRAADAAYRARPPSASEAPGLRRIHYLGSRFMFRGLEPNPNGEGWMVFVGVA